MRPIIFLSLLLRCDGAASAASAGASARAAARAARDSPEVGDAGACLPLLRSGTVFGAQYSRPASPSAGNKTDVFRAEMLSRGANLLQLSIPWSDVETTPGEPNYVLIAEILNDARAKGLVPLFEIAAIDTEHASVPADLADPNDPTLLRAGLQWNSTEVIDRYALLLEVVAPLAAYAGAVYIGVGNEVSVNLGLHPETAQAFADFAFTMRAWIRTLTTADMAVGVTMTVGDLDSWAPPSGTIPAWATLLFEVADVVPITYYPLRADFSVDDPADITKTFDGALSVLPADACVVLQELGCPSGYGNASSTDGSSQATQAAFLRQMIDVLHTVNATREVRAVSVYQTCDMDDSDCEGLAQYYNITDPAFVEYLCTLGLLKNTGVAKEAWAAFLDLIGSAQNSAAPPRMSSAPPPWPTFGFVIGGEQWGPNISLSSSSALAALNDLAATGATTVRVLVTGVVDSPSSTSIHAIPDGPLRTATPADVAPLLAAATSLNLSIILSPYVDIDWSSASNIPLHPLYSPGSISRHDIGASFTAAEWDAFFDSWATFLEPWAAVAAASAAPTAQGACALSARGGVVALTLGDGLNAAFAQTDLMRALVARIRSTYKNGCLSLVASGAVLNVVPWDALDFIGHEAFWPLSTTAVPIGAPLAAGALNGGWDNAISALGQASAAHGGMPVVLLSAGAQSRPNCQLWPGYTGAPSSDPRVRTPDGNDQGDNSAWPTSYEPRCQAAVYDSLLATFSTQPWFAGVTFWKWAIDSTAGGPSDTDFTPHGKAAEKVFRAWAGAPPNDGVEAIASALRRDMASLADASKGTAGGARRAAFARASNFTGFRGFLFGGPDEWSSPNYRLDSAGALQSLDNLRSLGATATQVVIQWYVASVNDTTMYPILDPDSVMKTTTDAEFLVFAAAARARNISIALSPMLDPDWTLATQLGCRTNWPFPPGCGWRGQIGQWWDSDQDDCSKGGTPEWQAWHRNYAAFILHYAALAEQGGADSCVTPSSAQSTEPPSPSSPPPPDDPSTKKPGSYARAHDKHVRGSVGFSHHGDSQGV